MTAITALSTLTTDLTTNLTAMSTSAASYVSHAAPAAVSFANGPHDGDGPGWWVLFPIAWLLIIVTVITFVALTVRRRGRQWGRQWGRRAGEGRLAERYANGEIDEQEYRARLATLRQLGEE